MNNTMGNMGMGNGANKTVNPASLVQMGVTQLQGMAPKKVINIQGTEYILCKDASDSTTAFPHNRVNFQFGDCVKVEREGFEVYFCYLHGIIHPLPNSLEKSVNVYYTGFHKNQIDMRFISPNDIARMNVYKADTTNWASEFALQILGREDKPTETRDPISPFPEWVGGSHETSGLVIGEIPENNGD